MVWMALVTSGQGLWLPVRCRHFSALSHGMRCAPSHACTLLSVSWFCSEVLRGNAFWGKCALGVAELQLRAD